MAMAMAMMEVRYARALMRVRKSCRYTYASRTHKTLAKHENRMTIIPGHWVDRVVGSPLLRLICMLVMLK